jgi:hypothetical protein
VPAKETAQVPAKETVLALAKETVLAPARETVLALARETVLALAPVPAMTRQDYHPRSIRCRRHRRLPGLRHCSR